MFNRKQKRCPHCKAPKPLKEFYRVAQGYSSWCRACVRQFSHDQTLSGKRAARRLAAGVKPRRKLSPEEKKLVLFVGGIMDRVKRSQERKGKTIGIDREWIYAKVIEFQKSNYCCMDKGSPFRPSLDRKDRTKGYFPENLRVVWVIENLARNVFSDEHVIEFCQRKLGLWREKGRRTQ